MNYERIILIRGLHLRNSSNGEQMLFSNARII